MEQLQDVIDRTLDGLFGEDLRAMSRDLSTGQLRVLVNFYYRIQEDRKRAKNREWAVSGNEEPTTIIRWTARQMFLIERTVVKFLDYYTEEGTLNQWCRSNIGVGPIITAGLAAHIDFTKCKTGSSIVRFAGYDPTSVWAKGQPRPWNAFLKRLCWNLGECFIKTQNHKESFYGPYFVRWRHKYQQRNERGEYAERAKEILATKKFGKATESYKAYSNGFLPAAQIHAMARRKAIILFLNHYFLVGYTAIHNRLPDSFAGYAITMAGHCREHFIPPPNWPFPHISLDEVVGQKPVAMVMGG